MKLQVTDVSDLKKQIKNWARMLAGDEIVLLEGHLGAGKTTFVHALVQSRWDVSTDSVASPTYALHHQYFKPNLGTTSKGALDETECIDHWDLFRVEDLSELDAAGFWDLVSTSRSLWIVEWPQKIDPSHWPQTRRVIRVKIQVRAGGQREIEISE